MTRVLITGAAGFAGSHIAEWIVGHTAWDVLSLDCLTYAGHLAALEHLPIERVTTVYHDFSNPLPDLLLEKLSGIDYIIHNGAESHVMRSLQNPSAFVQANIVGTFNMLEATRKIKPKKFIYVSTDEVFGPAQNGHAFTESDVLAPSNPYSATKASGEMLAYSYHKAFAVPVIITRTMNMFGERQHPEKFVPMTIRKVLRGKIVDIHTNAQANPNMRQWSHASVQASAQTFLLRYGTPGETYHVAGTELTNFDVAEMIAEILGKPLLHSTVDITQKFPGHDHGYSLDDAKLRGLGWKPPVSCIPALCATVQWAKEHQEWLED